MMRQPASENRFTVACPMPREAPVSTMVFCSAEGRSISVGTPGKGQSTAISSADPCSDRRSGSAFARIDDRGCAATIRNAKRREFSDTGGFARSGPVRRDQVFAGKAAGSDQVRTIFRCESGRMSIFRHGPSCSIQSAKRRTLGIVRDARRRRSGLVRFLHGGLRWKFPIERSKTVASTT